MTIDATPGRIIAVSEAATAPKLFSQSTFPTNVDDIHESVFRSYQTLRFVRYMLEHKVPSDVILKLLYEIDSLPPLRLDRTAL